MRYIKIILTIIAVLLALNLLRNGLPIAQATHPYSDVNITHIGGMRIRGARVPVEVSP